MADQKKNSLQPSPRAQAEGLTVDSLPAHSGLRLSVLTSGLRLRGRSDSRRSKTGKAGSPPEKSQEQQTSESDNPMTSGTQTNQPTDTPTDQKSNAQPVLSADSSDMSKSAQPSEPAQQAEPEETSQEASSASSLITINPTKDVKGAHWYVVHTYSGHEAKVAATLKQRVESQKLQDKILEIMVPTQEKIEIREGKKNTVREKIFPGYLLIKMVLDDNTWLAVRTTPGITSFVGTSNKPTPLPPQEVLTIQRFMKMEAPKFKTTFSVGEAIKIVDGPFSEFLGSISEMDEEKGKLKVLVSIFGRETPVELDFLQVAKLWKSSEDPSKITPLNIY